MMHETPEWGARSRLGPGAEHMKIFTRLFAALAVLALGIAGLESAAHGVTASSASLTMQSPTGDYIGQGQSYAYSTASNDAFNSTSTAGFVEVNLTSHAGDWWTLDFAAPAGQSLTPNTTYDNSIRYPFQGTGPGHSAYGEGRGG